MANITLEAVEAVMEQANAEFPAAKQALLNTDGDVQAAVSLLTEKAEDAESGSAGEDAESGSAGEQPSSEAAGSEEETACGNGDSEAEPESCGCPEKESAGAEGCTEDAADAESESCSEGAETGQDDPKIVVEEIIAKIRAAIKAGNVDRILIRRNDEILVNIPVNLGLVGSAIALTAAPGALIAAAIAAYGFSCKIEIVRKDGSNEEL